MSLIEVQPGINLYAQDLGSGPPVVLLAGFGLSHPVFDAEVRELLDAGHRVICVDLRGTGRSDKPSAGYNAERMVADVAAVLEALHVTAATLLGWSFGGQVAFRLAAERPDLIDRLVLLATTAVRASRSDAFPFRDPPETLLKVLQGSERKHRLLARRRTIAGGFAAQPPDPDALEFLIRTQLEMPSWSAVACYDTYLNWDAVDLLERVRQPVLQIVGDSDPVTPLEAIEWLQERLRGARPMVVLPDCGHYPMFEAGAAMREALLAFAAP